MMFTNNDDNKKIKEIEERADEIVKTAQQRSYEIIHEARDTASQIVQDAEKLSEEVRNQYKVEFRLAIERQNAGYEQMLQVMRSETLTVINQMLGKMKTAYLQEIDGFKQSLQSQTELANKELAGKIQQQWQTVETSVEGYKQQRVSQVDVEIESKIAEIAKEVLGKVLTKSDQLESVKQAILEAKQKHGW